MATETITLTYANGQGATLLDFFAIGQSYQATLADGSSNPETKQQFLHRKVKEFVRDSIRAGKLKAELNAARQDLVDDIDALVQIT